MSWFDTSGLASLAKTALKEAQKTIDKALDIKEDELSLTLSDAKLLPSYKMDSIRPVNMNQAESPGMPSSVWGSFSGSFFENPNSHEIKTVTTPPSSTSKRDESYSNLLGIPIKSDGEKSECQDSQYDGTNSSGSIEIVSLPTTPGSNLTSPGQFSCSTVQGSESVEIIGNDTPTSELFTPDSIAITNTSSSVSELESNICPESVEIISDEIVEDISLEDDSMSNNTVTESTTTTVKQHNMEVAITTPPCRLGLFLSLDNSITDSKPCDVVKSKIIILQDNVADLEKKVPKLLEDAMIEKSIENLETQTQLSDSTQSFEYVHQNLIQEENRGTSPNSSDEKSDMVKINSEQNSGHTSADEVETATSSDIEIISSPNGDSSSTNSAYKASSLNKILIKTDSLTKKKGHCRESSETSTHSLQSNASDDSHLSTQSETEKLLRRISELSEILESREYKLMELGRENAELHEKNADMKFQLEAKRKRDDNIEISSVTEEYTQRMSALEKKFQQSIRERDNLRDQLKTTRMELSGKVSKEDFEKVISDKNFMIQELKIEGEKLSKQILQHSNIIKKLRAKEKESDGTLKKQKEHIEELAEETERLKKSLSAKDEVERSQIEAVHKLSSEKRKLDKECSQLRSQLEDFTQKLKTMQTSFDAAKKEINEKQQKHSELSRKAEIVANLESEKIIAQTQNQQMINELNNLRHKLRQVENGNSIKEQSLRQENSQLLQRLEEIEMRAEEQAQAITQSTIPLVRQLESLQVSLNLRTTTWENQEKNLLEKLDESQKQLKKLEDIEQKSNEQLLQANGKMFDVEERFSSAILRYEHISSLLQEKELDFELKENIYKRDMDSLTKNNTQMTASIDEYKNQILSLQNKLDIEKEIYTNEQRLHQEAAIKTKCNNQLQDTIEPDEGQSTREDSSPTLSLGQISIADSLSSNLWPLEDIDCISNSGRPSGSASLYGSSGFSTTMHSTSILENLQASLKQRDGENHQLQWELSRLQTDRNFLMAEVSNLTMTLESVKEKLLQNENIVQQFNEIQRKYDDLLLKYTEKVDRAQELQLDLLDVKDAYKIQIDDLLRQLKEKS